MKKDLESCSSNLFYHIFSVTPLIAIVYFYPVFSEKLLLLFGLPWVIKAPVSMLLLAIMFKKKYNSVIANGKFSDNKCRMPGQMS